jgi:TonB family protein
MKMIFVTNIALIFAINVHSQLINDTVYFNSNWEQSDYGNAQYYRIISNDTSGKYQFFIRDYYLSGQIQMTGSYKSINPDYKLGKFYYYHKNGQLQIECTYYKNKLEGKYLEYYKNGQLKSSMSYKSGLLYGLEKRWSAEGKLKKEVEYKEGMKHGKFLSYYDNGSLVRRDIYKNDKFIKGRCFTREGKDTSYFEYFVMPKFKGGLEGFKKYVLDKIIYPEIAKKNYEEGRVYVKFTVDKAGNLIKPVIVKEDKDYFNKEALRVISSSPRWIPGKRDGQIIDVSITIPIFFKLSRIE